MTTGNAYLHIQNQNTVVKNKHTYMNLYKPIKLKKYGNVSKFEAVMRQRWLKNLTYLPQIDKHDIAKEVPLINGGRTIKPSNRHQADAEYSQTCYLRLREQEEHYRLFNYLDPACNRRFNAFLKEGAKNTNFDLDEILDQDDRSYAVQKIFELHNEKQYKCATLFTAVYTFDNYLAKVDHWTFNREDLCLLATAALLIAAKVEEPESPNFKRMISHLNP